MTLAEKLFVGYCGMVLASHLVVELLASYAEAASAGLAATEAPEPVTLVKPVYGRDPFTESCFVSWLAEDYAGEVQFIFSLQDPEDEALALLEELGSRPGLRPFEVMVNPIESGYHGKTSNLLHGVRAARHELLVLSDADTEADVDTLAKLVGAQQACGGMVGCLVRHDRPRGLWGKIYAAIWNAAILYSCGPTLALTSFGMAPGGTVALRAQDLARMGGIEVLRHKVTDDLALNLAAQRIGLVRALGPTVRSPVGELAWSGWQDKLSRATATFAELPGYPLAALPLLGYYAYLLAIPLFAWHGNTPMVYTGMGFLAIRALFGGLITRRSEGFYRWAPELVLADVCIVACLLGSPFQRGFTWDGVAYNLDASERLKRP